MITEGNYGKKKSQVGRQQDLNRGLPEYESSALPTTAAPRSVLYILILRSLTPRKLPSLRLMRASFPFVVGHLTSPRALDSSTTCPDMKPAANLHNPVVCRRDWVHHVKVRALLQMERLMSGFSNVRYRFYSDIDWLAAVLALHKRKIAHPFDKCLLT